MATTKKIIFVVLSILSTIVVLCVALTKKRNLQNVGSTLRRKKKTSSNLGGSNGKQVTLRRKPAPKKTSRNLGASSSRNLGFSFSDLIGDGPLPSWLENATTSTTTLTSGPLESIPKIPTGEGIKSGGCNNST